MTFEEIREALLEITPKLTNDERDHLIELLRHPEQESATSLDADSEKRTASSN